MSHPTESFMQPVVAALKAGRRIDAVRHFQAAVAHQTGLGGAGLAAWVEQQLGRKLNSELVKALAQYPCMGCKKGLVICEDCEGRAQTDDQRMCDKCTGLGAANCDFCGGSGWITYRFVPVGMRSAVVIERAKMVLNKAQELLAEPLPPPGRKDAKRQRVALGQAVLRANRYLGALDNAIGLCKRPQQQEHQAQASLQRVAAVCRKAASRLEKRVRQALKALARLEADQARNSQNSSHRDRASRRSKYFEQRAASASFVGTSLDHLHLRELDVLASSAPARPKSTPRSAASSRSHGMPSIAPAPAQEDTRETPDSTQEPDERGVTDPGWRPAASGE